MKVLGRSFEDIANELVTIVPERGAELDFTQHSLLVVEEMLAEAAANLGEIGDDEQRRIIEGFGCYILEVARRTFGGRYLWHDAQAEPVLVVGEPDRHVALMAWSRVRGRLSGDVGDNIPFFFEGFEQRVRLNKPSDHVLFC